MGASNLNQSLTSQQVRIDNFVPQLSGKITTSGTSSSFTFSPLTATLRTSFSITNKGLKGAYIGWGVGAATAVASSSSGSGIATYYIPAGAVEVLDFQSSTGVVDTIAAIQGSDSQDSGSTILEISLGFGN